MSCSVQVNPARLLADNLRSRQRLGLGSIPGRVQAQLKDKPEAAAIAFESKIPLDGAPLRLWEAMLAVLGLTLRDVKEAPARAGIRLRLLCEENERADGNWCWHPALLLAKPELKKHAYRQLKAIAPLLRQPS